MPAPTHARPAPVLHAEGLVRTHGAVAALDGVDFTIRPGEVVAVLGPNGSGKTTLVECLTFQQRPDAGRRVLFGREPRGLGRDDRARIGVVLQDARTDSELTAREHLTMFAGYHGAGPEQAEVLLDRVGLLDAADRRVHRLSGGQKRKLEVAVALVGDPELLFLDEPTTGLDVETRSELWRNIRAHSAAGSAVILTTHYLEEAEALADRVDVLVDGRVVASGALAALLAATPADANGEKPRSLTDAYVALVAAARGRGAPVPTPTT
jgi:ABC-2 type transport system ATP-binding protein